MSCDPRIAALLVSTTALGACMHSGTPPASSLGPSAANFTYYAPSAQVNLVGDFVLLRCEAGRDGIQVSSSLSLVASGDADTDAAFSVEGASLMSAIQRRELAIELYDNGTLKSVNASSSDQTGAVVVNILKTIGSIAGAVMGAAAPATESGSTQVPSPCNAETARALEQADQYRAALESLRGSLIGANPADVESIGARMELIAHQLALLITTRLTITVNRQLDLGDGPTGAGESRPIQWRLRDLARWFANDQASSPCQAMPGSDFGDGGDDPCAATTSLLAMTYSVSAVDVAPPQDRMAQSPCRLSAQPSAECGRTIVMPRPARATITFRAETPSVVGRPNGAVLGRAAVAVPQWGYATYLPVNVRAFQSRSVGYTFNTFGERQSFKWNSQATAENATGAIQAGSEAAAGIVTTVRGPTETARLTAENAELEARMANNRLRLCEQAILAGATTCE